MPTSSGHPGVMFRRHHPGVLLTVLMTWLILAALAAVFFAAIGRSALQEDRALWGDRPLQEDRTLQGDRARPLARRG